jgi:hypothetical protein
VGLHWWACVRTPSSILLCSTQPLSVLRALLTVVM